MSETADATPTAEAPSIAAESEATNDDGETSRDVEPASGRGARAPAGDEPGVTQSGVSDTGAESSDAATEEPAAPEAPVATEEPAATEAPVATEEPAATEAPVATEEPAATEEPVATEEPAATEEPVATEAPVATEEPVVAGPERPVYFETIPAGTPLPTEQECAAMVRAVPLAETHSQNDTANATAGGPSVRIDGADEYWNSELAPRITGNFTGTTEELIRWAACKWGFDEDLTRARAWTESSWRVDTEGDRTSNTEACRYLELENPCYQSYGLLQVKGTVHQGTYPFAHESSAWGLDYAMAWQRACFEGSFEWLNASGYVANDVQGCVGAWYSGEWYDSAAQGYLEDVGDNLNGRPWD